ncbi:MAG: AAA family ATPase [Vibrio toranzoniae]|uniref:AAA family ATPase n=1 Tax=Vibrio toranzoniae TaxID=1194427 RepID=UPI003F99A7BC
MILTDQVAPMCFRVTRSAYNKKGHASFLAVEVDSYLYQITEPNIFYVIEIEDNDSSYYLSTLVPGVICQLIPNTMLEKKIKYEGVTVSKRFVTTDNFMLVRPSGDLIIDLLSKGRLFKGIGKSKAQALWAALGESIYDALEQKDQGLLEVVLTPKTARNLIDSWKCYTYSDALAYCCKELKLKSSTAFNVSRYYQHETQAKIQSDPYRLLAFSVNFEDCDKIASKYHIQHDDPRRLSAAIETVFYQALDQGDTIVLQHELYEALESILGVDCNCSEEHCSCFLRKRVRAIKEGIGKNYVQLDNERFQSLGAFAMESFVAKSITELVARSHPLHHIQKIELQQIVTQYETKNKITLTDAQKKAVFSALTYDFLLINGGAGVGKTTVLDVIYQGLVLQGIKPLQMAVAGKAAQRMKEATGVEAYTIARFIHHFSSELKQKSNMAVVIDESSMLDLASMYRLLTILPSTVKIILVGDIAQLPPIGFGLVLHELDKLGASIPRIDLTEVKRQSGTSAIPLVANFIRQGVCPEFNSSDVQFTPQKFKKKAEKLVLEAYQRDPEFTQIICPTNRLVSIFNQKCAELNTARKLSVFNHDFEAYSDTKFRLGDKVICNKNLYKYDVMNGSIGWITECYAKSSLDMFGEVSHGKIEWQDGQLSEITDEILEHLAHAYAITIHKSQGSQFDKVVIPIFMSPNLDRSMLYTAVTRAEKRVTIIGDEKQLKASISQVSVECRQVGLADKLRQQRNLSKSEQKNTN